MHYSIKGDNNRSFNDNPIPAFVEWEITKSLYSLYDEYQENYVIKNDVLFLDSSYFKILCKKFKNLNFSISLFLRQILEPSFFEKEPFKENLAEIILLNRIAHYENQKIDYEKASEIAKHEIKNLSDFFNEIRQKNQSILVEFKSFILGFTNYIKEKSHQEHADFNFIYNLLVDDFSFFRNSKIDTLRKYKLSIGHDYDKHNEKRGKNNSFVPSGVCFYGSHIFINSNNRLKFGKNVLWEKRTVLRTFYHEIGHALDYLYFNENVLKKTSKERHSSYNRDFLKCVRLNYRNAQALKSKIPYKHSKSISYYCDPQISKINKSTEEAIPIAYDLYKETIKNANDIFSEFVPKATPKFSPVVFVNGVKYDYSRVLEEAWAESFSFIFSWLKEPFNEYDRYILKSDKSYERIIIKTLYHSLIYILYNFDWSKLNIPDTVVLKRRVEIRKFLDYIYNMPICLNGVNNKREIKKKKYFTLNDMLTKR